MNVPDIQAALAQRLHRVIEQVYERSPAGEPELPCAVIEFPSIANFHTEMSHTMTLIDWDVRLLVGRGDADDALDRLAKWISTEGDDSVIRAIEDRDERYPNPPWTRIRCASTDTPRAEGSAIGLTLTLEMHA